MNSIIRSAILNDCTAIAEIYSDAILNSAATFDTNAKSETEIADWLKSHERSKFPFLVVELDKQVLAWAALNPWSDRCAYANTAEISIYVNKDSRGQKIGFKLMSAILEDARKAGLHTVLSRITSDNKPAILLTQKAGFQLVGTMKEVGHKFGKFHDVCLYQIIFNI